MRGIMLRKLLTYLATAVVAFLASPFVVLVTLLIGALATFLILSLFGIVTVALALLIPMGIAGGILALAVFALFRLLR